MTCPVLLNSLVKTVVLPPTGLLLLAIFGLMVAMRRPRLGRVIALVAVLTLLALSTPLVSSLLMATLHPPSPFAQENARKAQAIVILGGGVRRHAADYGGETLAALTLERVRYGARLARITGLPILVSGGATQPGESEAALMQQALEEEFNVPVRWIEPASQNTHENAVQSARILRAAGVHTVVLVIHGFDMRRAAAEFEAEGIEAIPAATGLSTPGPTTLGDWMPGMAGLQASYYALYEILANFARWAIAWSEHNIG